MKAYSFSNGILRHQELVEKRVEDRVWNLRLEIKELEVEVEELENNLGKSIEWHKQAMKAIANICFSASKLEELLNSCPQEKEMPVLADGRVEFFFRNFYKIWPKNELENIESHRKFLKYFFDEVPK